MASQLAAGVAASFGDYGTIRMQVVGLSGGDTITVYRSFDGTNFVVADIIGAGFSTPTTIVVDGIYTMDAGGSVKWIKSGTASTPVVTMTPGS